MTAADLRPDLGAALDALLVDICKVCPRFHSLSSSSILVVAQGAWGTAAASIRALAGNAENVVIKGKPRHLELCLRPPFFQRGDLQARLQVLVHELLHVDLERPHLLSDDMRHDRVSQDDVDAMAKELTDALVKELDPIRTAPLGHHGEVWMTTWLNRPIPQTSDRPFGDDDVEQSIVRLRTEPSFRTGWG